MDSLSGLAIQAAPVNSYARRVAQNAGQEMGGSGARSGSSGRSEVILLEAREVGSFFADDLSNPATIFKAIQALQMSAHTTRPQVSRCLSREKILQRGFCIDCSTPYASFRGIPQAFLSPEVVHGHILDALQLALPHADRLQLLRAVFVRGERQSVAMSGAKHHQLVVIAGVGGSKQQQHKHQSHTKGGELAQKLEELLATSDMLKLCRGSLTPLFTKDKLQSGLRHNGSWLLNLWF